MRCFADPPIEVGGGRVWRYMSRYNYDGGCSPSAEREGSHWRPPRQQGRKAAMTTSALTQPAPSSASARRGCCCLGAKAGSRESATDDVTLGSPVLR